MKSPQLFLLLLFISLVPAAAIGQTVNPRDWSPTWINPSWERPANMVADGPISLPGDLTVDQLETSTICGGCHNAILEQWKGSMHANALIDPVFQAASKLFLSEVTAAGDREEALACVRCHTPFGHLSKTAETTAADYAAATEALGTRSGIFCDFCHSVESSAGVGNAPFLVDAGQGDAQKIKHGPRTDAVSPYHETAFSDLHTKSEFCGMCHDVTHTFNGMPIERTYTEWRESPYNTGDPATTVYCQDCHMRQRPGIPATGSTDRLDNPGISAVGGKERNHVSTHYIVGANAAVPALLGGEDNAAIARENLQNCATIEITAPTRPLAWQNADIHVTVNNVGAGHYLPTGLSEVREMWLEIMVKDTRGRTIFESGGVDSEGNLKPDTRLFNIKMADKEGNPTINVAKADRIVKDSRIPPKGYRTEQYTFFVPLRGIRGYTVEARLQYRSAPQSTINALLGSAAPTLPIIEMTSASAEVSF
jgi:hypothetical protein